jgi:hypothetical protein
MVRLALIALILAAGIGLLAFRANAQSPDPALLSPPGERADWPHRKPRRDLHLSKAGWDPPKHEVSARISPIASARSRPVAAKRHSRALRARRQATPLG